MGFSYNSVDYVAQYNTRDATFAYYLRTDGSKFGYDLNTILSNIQFTGQNRLATASTLLMAVPRTLGLNRIPLVNFQMMLTHHSGHVDPPGKWAINVRA